RSSSDFSFYLQYVLVAQLIEFRLIVDYDLCYAGSIPEINKSYPTVIAAASHPACHGNSLANVFGIECAELMGAKHVVFRLLSSSLIKNRYGTRGYCTGAVFTVLTGLLLRFVVANRLLAVSRFLNQLVSGSRFECL